MRAPELSRFLVEGSSPHPTQEDFETVPERTILVAAQEVANTVGLPANGKLTWSSVGEVIRTMINIGSIEGSIAPDVLPYLVNLSKGAIDSPYFLHHLPKFLEEQRSLAAIRNGSALNPAALAESLTQAVASSSMVGRRSKLSSIDDGLPDHVEPIPTGYTSLDVPMGGGPGRKEAVMIAAGTGIGKTTFALNLQLGHARQGYRAGLFSLELTNDKICQRRYSLCSHLDYTMVKQAGLKDADPDYTGPTKNQIKEMVRQGIIDWGNMGAMSRMPDFDYSGDEATVERIDQDLTLEAEAGEPLDVCLIDWLECLELPSRNSGMNKRQQIDQMAPKELRHRIELLANKTAKLAIKHNLLLYLFTQTNFDVQNKEVVRMKDKSEAKGAARKMSYFLGMGMNPDTPEYVTITADKTRDSGYFQCQLRRMLHEQRFEDMEVALEN